MKGHDRKTVYLHHGLDILETLVHDLHSTLIAHSIFRNGFLFPIVFTLL
jgi:hypothetical protein